MALFEGRLLSILPIILINGALILTLLSTHSFGVAVLELNDTKKVNICEPLTLRFTDYRFGGKMFYKTVSIPGMLPLIRKDDDADPITAPGINITEYGPELQFLMLQDSVLEDYYRNISNKTGVIMIQYDCTFTPFNCTITHLASEERFVTYKNGTLRDLEGNWTKHTNMNESEAAAFALGNGTDILSNKSEDIQARWKKLCNRILSEDDPKKNAYVFRVLETYGKSNVQNETVECRMESDLPLNYNISVYNKSDNLKMTFLADGFYGNARLMYYYFEANVKSLSDMVCEIRSPTGWVVNMTFFGQYSPQLHLVSTPHHYAYTKMDDYSHDFETHITPNQTYNASNIIVMIIFVVVVTLSIAVPAFMFRENIIRCVDRYMFKRLDPAIFFQSRITESLEDIVTIID
ncbi:b153 [Murid betaherpesvirus 8]|uniref:B153 n=1 Tax=Rat cytomegalovirus (isolate England) TaxID=1261657 RepID=A0A0E3SWS3_RCMVE|nr:b153 [Murid betaherpesvirus 8]WPH25045.1 b153 [Murid betaherpesvirus 8]WPH25179.1 b153 [Murid betaherpesvirus 8]